MFVQNQLWTFVATEQIAAITSVSGSWTESVITENCTEK
jgi:hypothetical protein